MKTAIAAFIILIVSGCTIGPSKIAKTIEYESRESISQFAQPGKTSNIAILEKFKKPTAKLVRDDSKYTYMYAYWDRKTKSYGFFPGLQRCKSSKKQRALFLTAMEF